MLKTFAVCSLLFITIEGCVKREYGLSDKLSAATELADREEKLPKNDTMFNKVGFLIGGQNNKKTPPPYATWNRCAATVVGRSNGQLFLLTAAQCVFVSSTVGFVDFHDGLIGTSVATKDREAREDYFYFVRPDDYIDDTTSLSSDHQIQVLQIYLPRFLKPTPATRKVAIIDMVAAQANQSIALVVVKETPYLNQSFSVASLAEAVNPTEVFAVNVKADHAYRICHIPSNEHARLCNGISEFSVPVLQELPKQFTPQYFKNFNVTHLFKDNHILFEVADKALVLGSPVMSEDKTKVIAVNVGTATIVGDNNQRRFYQVNGKLTGSVAEELQSIFAGSWTSEKKLFFEKIIPLQQEPLQ